MSDSLRHRSSCVISGSFFARGIVRERPARPAWNGLEPLEPRLLLTDTTIYGTTGNDTITLRRDGDHVDVSIFSSGGTTNWTFDLTPYSHLYVNSLAGDDALILDFTDGSPLPAGGLTFDGGDGSDTLQVSCSATAGPLSVGADTLDNVETLSLVDGAAVTIDAAQDLTAMTVNGGSTAAFNADIAPDPDNAALALTLNGTSKVLFKHSQELASLCLNDTSVAEVYRGYDYVLRTAHLSIASTATTPAVPTAKLDLNDASLIVDYVTGSNPIADIAGWIKAGYHDRQWDGNGITSTRGWIDARAYPWVTGQGVAKNREPGIQYDTFMGYSVSATSILVRYTVVGDMNLNGRVDDNDVTILVLNYDHGSTSNKYWYQGDISGYDGRVDDNDVTLLVLNYHKYLSNLLTAARIQDVSPNSRVSQLDSLGILFGRPLNDVDDFDISHLSLTRDGTDVTLGATETLGPATLTAIDDTTYLLGGLGERTGEPGTYQLTFLAEDIEDNQQPTPKPLAGDTRITWTLAVTMSGYASVDDGTEYELHLTSVSSVGENITGWQIDWGDGSVSAGQSSNDWGPDITQESNLAKWTATHTYADGTNCYGIWAIATTAERTYIMANQGVVDETFGKVTTDFSNRQDCANAVAVDAYGKIVVAGRSGSYFAVARYNTDGELDGSFGTGGRKTTNFGGSACGYGVALDPNGKIVVVGSKGGDFALARYDTNGNLDTDFGLDGRVVTGVGDASGAYGVALDPNEKIVVVGSRDGDFALARYKTDGSLDSDFGDGGWVITDFGGVDCAYSVVVDTSGRIVVAGYSADEDFEVVDFALARYTTNGILDTSFAPDDSGMVKTDFGDADCAYSVAVDSDEVSSKIVVGGYSGTDFALARYSTDGSLDTSFGSDGKVVTDLGTASDYICGVAVQADRKIVVAGCAGSDAALARYDAQGKLDDTFGMGGKTSPGFANSPACANAVALQADGQIVVAGKAGNDFALARFGLGGVFNVQVIDTGPSNLAAELLPSPTSAVGTVEENSLRIFGIVAGVGGAARGVGRVAAGRKLRVVKTLPVVALGRRHRMQACLCGRSRSRRTASVMPTGRWSNRTGPIAVRGSGWWPTWARWTSRAGWACVRPPAAAALARGVCSTPSSPSGWR